MTARAVVLYAGYYRVGMAVQCPDCHATTANVRERPVLGPLDPAWLDAWIAAVLRLHACPPGGAA